MIYEHPWVSFCISTYKRPGFLKNQLESLLSQTFENFEIVISDNDPDGSGREISEAPGDSRIRYFHNGENLGMIASFNRSIDRAAGEYIVMVTDDDPVDNEFLMVMAKLNTAYPGYPVYAGFRRNSTSPGSVEIITSGDFMSEILDPSRTPWFLWSSCIIKKETALAVNKIPDYGSPHLADHAFIAMAGSSGGGVIVNAAFSSLTSHETNFSKFNFQYYVNGCSGFYDTLLDFCNWHNTGHKNLKAIKKHLRIWFISCIFNLKHFYTTEKNDPYALKQVEECAKAILALPFMKEIAPRFLFKQVVFRIKKKTGIIR